jgi:hypothetical protein
MRGTLIYMGHDRCEDPYMYESNYLTLVKRSLQLECSCMSVLSTDTD